VLDYLPKLPVTCDVTPLPDEFAAGRQRGSDAPAFAAALAAIDSDDDPAAGGSEGRQTFAVNNPVSMALWRHRSAAEGQTQRCTANTLVLGIAQAVLGDAAPRQMPATDDARATLIDRVGRVMGRMVTDARLRLKQRADRGRADAMRSVRHAAMHRWARHARTPSRRRAGSQTARAADRGGGESSEGGCSGGDGDGPPAQVGAGWRPRALNRYAAGSSAARRLARAGGGR
jgi:hypothetical protein